MFVIIGIIVVLVAVLGGFLLEGGNILVLMQWAEFLIIGGSAIGALLVATPKSTLVKIVRYILGSLKSSGVSKASFLELLQLQYEIFQTARVKGLLTLEGHVERPEESELFNKYPAFLKDHHTLEYLVDSLKLMVVQGVPPLELEALLESDLEVQGDEGKKPAHALGRTADSLPGLGIVAAVLGIVLTMQAIGGPAAEVGHKVGSALVGTFLGVFMCYGFVQPLSAQIEYQAELEELYMHSIKAGVVAYAKAMPPIVAVEFAPGSSSTTTDPVLPKWRRPAGPSRSEPDGRLSALGFQLEALRRKNAELEKVSGFKGKVEKIFHSVSLNYLFFKAES